MPVVAASWAVRNGINTGSPCQQVSLSMRSLFVISLLMHVLLGSDMITGWLIATVYHFALVSGH